MMTDKHFWFWVIIWPILIFSIGTVVGYRISSEEHAFKTKQSIETPKTYCKSLGSKERYVAQEGTDYVCFTEDINTKRITKSLIVIQD